MAATLTLGPIRLTLLLDATMRIDGDSLFHPARREEWTLDLKPDEQGALPVVVNGVLISEGNRHTLVDTGLGEDEGGKARAQNLLKSLAAAGLQAKQIGRVLLTHSHGDHVMGNTLWRGGRWLPTFPLAEYVIQKQEAEAVREENQEIWRTRLAPLVERDQLRTIDGYAQIDEHLSCWPTPGHTIGHQSVVLRTSQQHALILGDLAILAQNLEHLQWAHSWAWSSEADARSRREVNEWAIAHGAVLVVPHDPEMPWVQIQRAGDEYRALPYMP
jgi:glyoxylase-like metal-dependent hydrolase (beta-lactamase superfamily II)